MTRALILLDALAALVAAAGLTLVARPRLVLGAAANDGAVYALRIAAMMVAAAALFAAGFATMYALASGGAA